MFTASRPSSPQPNQRPVRGRLKDQDLPTPTAAISFGSLAWQHRACHLAMWSPWLTGYGNKLVSYPKAERPKASQAPWHRSLSILIFHQ